MKRVLIILSIALLSTPLFGQNILLVGNSLSYTNDMPAMLRDIGKALGRKLQADCLCFPNYGLEDHWKVGMVQEKIHRNKQDFVIFQQGPSSQAYGRRSLKKYGGLISDYARKFGAKPVYFMVWPSLQYYGTFDGVIKNHRDAALQNKAMLAPLGEYWRTFRKTFPNVNLYGNDGFHPSKAGSFLGALTLYKTLYPETDLSTLKYKEFNYLMSKGAFEQMIALVESGGQ